MDIKRIEKLFKELKLSKEYNTKKLTKEQIDALKRYTQDKLSKYDYENIVREFYNTDDILKENKSPNTGDKDK